MPSEICRLSKNLFPIKVKSIVFIKNQKGAFTEKKMTRRKDTGFLVASSGVRLIRAKVQLIGANPFECDLGL